MNTIKLYESSITKKIFKNCDNFGNITMIKTVSGKKITGLQYKNASISYAIKLINSGVKKGDNIVIFIKDITIFSYISLSVLLVGAKLILIEPDYSESILESKLKFIKPDLLIIEGFLYFLLKTPFINKFLQIHKYKSLIKYSKKITIENGYNNINISSNKNISFIKSDINSECLVVFTGGTTGYPKGVVHTLDSLKVMFIRIGSIIGNDTKIFYADLPHFVLIGISIGVKVIVGKNNINDKTFVSILRKFKIDTTFSPPYRYLYLLNGKKKIPNSIKHICLGSAPVHNSFLQKLYNNIGGNIKISCIYGMTEILPIAYITGKEKLDMNIKGDVLGRVFNDIHIKVLENGELEVSGKGLFKKYLGENNIKNHKTGDLVEYVNQNLIMKGRKKDMIIRKDYNIYPGLYEPIINFIPGVIESALVGIWNKKLEDEEIILFIEGEKLIKKDIFKKIKFGKYSIDIFALPDEIYFCKLPRIGRQNKIDKNYLKNYYIQLGK